MKVRPGGHLAAVQVRKTLGNVKCDMTPPIPPLQGAFAVLLYTLEEVAMWHILHYQGHAMGLNHDACNSFGFSLCE